MKAEWLQYFMFTLLGIGFLVLAYLIYRYGLGEGRRRMRRLVKRREHAPQAEDFVLMQAEDGAMEVKLSGKAYKKLRSEPIEGLISGQKGAMVFRIRRA